MAELKLRTAVHWLGALKQRCVKQIELKQLLCVLPLEIGQTCVLVKKEPKLI